MNPKHLRPALLAKKKELLHQLLKSSARFRLAQTALELDSLLALRANLLRQLQTNDQALAKIPESPAELANSTAAVLSLEVAHLLRSVWANNQASLEGMTHDLKDLDAQRRQLDQGAKVTGYLGGKRMPGVVPNPKFLRNGGYNG